MIERLAELGFSDAEIVSKQPVTDRIVVRAYHPVRGWMYEKFAPDDVTSLEAWAAKANGEIITDLRIGAK
jgi:hypothetical protein